MKKTLPAIPKVVPSILGAVSVTQVPGLKDERGTRCRGIWSGNDRKVNLDPDQGHVTAWQTYWHEWAHIVIADVGIEMSHALNERVCDAFANARVREMLDNGSGS